MALNPLAMKYKGLVFLATTLLAVALVAGCMSAPEEKANATEVKSAAVTEAQSNAEAATIAENNSTRFVELSFIGGGTVGGKYISESEAFVTIIPMYLVDKNGIMSRGNLKSIGIKTSMISVMTDIQDPTELINTTLASQDKAAEEKAIADQKAAEEKAAYYAEEKAKREAEQAKYQPTKKVNNTMGEERD